MMKGTSTGDWNKKSVLRVLVSNVNGEEVVSQQITGITSGDYKINRC